MTRRRLIAGALLGALCLGAAAAHADRLHLDGGGTIDTPKWWMEGDVLRYEAPGGTMGIPRSLVVRIERGEFGAPRGAAPLDDPPASPAQADAQTVERLNQATRALERREFEAASAMYLEALHHAPELQLARVGHALSEMALGRDGLALSVVLDGLAREPQHAELRELLGDLRNREERVSDALQAWREAFESAPSYRLLDKILNAERVLSLGR
jgi:hypothetical protein